MSIDIGYISTVHTHDSAQRRELLNRTCKVGQPAIPGDLCWAALSSYPLFGCSWHHHWSLTRRFKRNIQDHKMTRSEASGSLLYISVAIWNRQPLFLPTLSDSIVHSCTKLWPPVQSFLLLNPPSCLTQKESLLYSRQGPHPPDLKSKWVGEPD